MPKISQLPATSYPSLEHELPVARNNETVKLTVKQIRELLKYNALEVTASLLAADDTTVQAYLEKLRSEKLEIVDYNQDQTVLQNAIAKKLNIDVYEEDKTELENLLSTLTTDVIRHDIVQNLTLLEQSRARANTGAGILSGFRNKIINGNFDIWQRGTTQTANGYRSDDRWNNAQAGSTATHSRQEFANGQTAVPGNPTYYSRTVVTSVTGANNYVRKTQAIEDVRTFAGKTVTLTFYAKANAARSLAIECAQNLGTGGVPLAINIFATRKVNLTTSFQRFDVVVQVPSISGKTIGTDGNDYLGITLWFDAGTGFNARTGSLGHQSGTFDISRVSIVEGDATAEPDPFSPRHIQQELALCLRYFERLGGGGLTGIAAGPLEARLSGTWKVWKRTDPTLVLSVPASFAVRVPVESRGVVTNTASLTERVANMQGISRVHVVGFSGLTQGAFVVMDAANLAGDAEF